SAARWRLGSHDCINGRTYAQWWRVDDLILHLNVVRVVNWVDWSTDLATAQNTPSHGGLVGVIGVKSQTLPRSDRRTRRYHSHRRLVIRPNDCFAAAATACCAQNQQSKRGQKQPHDHSFFSRVKQRKPHVVQRE